MAPWRNACSSRSLLVLSCQQGSLSTSGLVSIGRHDISTWQSPAEAPATSTSAASSRRRRVHDISELPAAIPSARFAGRRGAPDISDSTNPSPRTNNYRGSFLQSPCTTCRQMLVQKTQARQYLDGKYYCPDCTYPPCEDCRVARPQDGRRSKRKMQH